MIVKHKKLDGEFKVKKIYGKTALLYRNDPFYIFNKVLVDTFITRTKNLIAV